MVSGYKQMFYLAATPQKKDNIRPGICFAYSCFPSIHLKSEIQLFRPRIAVNAVFFVHYCPSSLVSNQIYHRIDDILLASSKYGRRISRRIGANQKRQNILNE